MSRGPSRPAFTPEAARVLASARAKLAPTRPRDRAWRPTFVGLAVAQGAAENA